MPLSSSTSLPHSSISSPIWRSTILPPSTDPPLWSSPTLASTNSQSFLPGRPVVLEAKQEAKSIKASKSAGKKEDDDSTRPKKRSRTKPSEITWKTCPSLPDGWKTRIVFWSDREKPLFLTPSGKTLTSRKAVLAAMEAIGGYSQADFEKVKKSSHKRKKKPHSQWVQTKKKGKRKQNGKKKRDQRKSEERQEDFQEPFQSWQNSTSVILMETEERNCATAKSACHQLLFQRHKKRWLLKYCPQKRLDL